jgi:NAD(P)-dependent dehydrogenase (short-subunit alcohol dehydrogenase family)
MTSQDTRRSILITGAASGIGRATALHFAAQGWFVGCIDLNRTALDALRDEIGAQRAQFSAFDITDRVALLDAVGRFGAATGGTLDLLFNNAGIDAKGRFADMAWERVLAVSTSTWSPR